MDTTLVSNSPAIINAVGSLTSQGFFQLLTFMLVTFGGFMHYKTYKDRSKTKEMRDDQLKQVVNWEQEHLAIHKAEAAEVEAKINSIKDRHSDKLVDHKSRIEKLEITFQAQKDILEQIARVVNDLSNRFTIWTVGQQKQL